MLYRGRNRDYSFYLRPVFDISFALVWLFRLRVKSDHRHISLLAMIPKIPGGGCLRGSVRTGQACSDTHPKLSASQQQPTAQGASRGWGGGKKKIILLNGFFFCKDAPSLFKPTETFIIYNILWQGLPQVTQLAKQYLLSFSTCHLPVSSDVTNSFLEKIVISLFTWHNVNFFRPESFSLK